MNYLYSFCLIHTIYLDMKTSNIILYLLTLMDSLFGRRMLLSGLFKSELQNSSLYTEYRSTRDNNCIPAEWLSETRTYHTMIAEPISGVMSASMRKEKGN